MQVAHFAIFCTSIRCNNHWCQSFEELTALLFMPVCDTKKFFRWGREKSLIEILFSSIGFDIFPGIVGV